MTNPPRPILIIGGTRGTGLLIATLLQQRGHAVRVLARNPGKARDNLPHPIEVVPGDLTIPGTLQPALERIGHLILTAGRRSGRFATERQIRATEYEGTRNVLAAARATGFAGRFLYMNASGVTSQSLSARLLNLWKGNTLRWRCRGEAAIRSSGLDYTIIRAGVLLNRPAGTRSLVVTQRPLPLSLRYRVARSDMAEGFVAALTSARLSRATIEVIWGSGTDRVPWEQLFDPVRPDSDPEVAASGLTGPCR